jgi:hypothetical protein
MTEAAGTTKDSLIGGGSRPALLVGKLVDQHYGAARSRHCWPRIVAEPAFYRFRSARMGEDAPFQPLALIDLI